jgi:hypothetical protein
VRDAPLAGAKPQFPVRGCWIGPRVRFSLKENRMKCHGSLGLYRKLRAALIRRIEYGLPKVVP